MEARERPVPDGFVPMAEAVRRLGKSDRTIRRMIERGELEGEPIPRPQGTVWYVRLPPEDVAEDAAPSGDAASDQESIESALQAAVTALDAALCREQEMRAEAQAEVAELREERGRLMALHEADRARIADLTERLAAAEARLAKPWWRFWR